MVQTNQQFMEIKGMISRDQGKMTQWVEQVNQLEAKLLVTRGLAESMVDKLCHCNHPEEIVVVSPLAVPTPELSYAGSNRSYHTPPVEGSPANDSNAENAPVVDCGARWIPEGAH